MINVDAALMVPQHQRDQIGDLLDFGQLFKALGNNKFAQISHILRQFLKGVKIYHFMVKSLLGNFYRHLAIFFWSHCSAYATLFLAINLMSKSSFVSLALFFNTLTTLSLSFTYKHSHMHTSQCDQMDRLFFNNEPFTRIKTCPMAHKILPKLVQNSPK